ncbi:MAG TPA: transcriptional regulator [Steroidobacteraceae bacterium]|nr:transcriptional regulator [Steroidobacteraceae bacterium]
MSNRTTARRDSGDAPHEIRPSPGARRHTPEDDHFDRLIYGRVRLGILSALAVNDLLTFNDLKALFAVTDGNLGAHARKLEDAGYIACRKTFEERRPRTEYRLTSTGRKALERYLQHIEAVIRATRRA